ncbi:SprT family zinc-dependent metalloprotease [Rhizobium sp. 18065]|uniref:M48 family metallopeptidase n=1 Tax=Rhizobium sp. 18065 TaxID=2681411 RepID=UPI00135B10A5|nr:SprT family zinc-dependent metalloprotease [Rhizobium sp. 18065]
MFSLFKKPAATRTSSIALDRTLAVDGRELPLTIRRNIRATRITLRIEPGGRALKMTIPHGLKERDIDDFLDRHQGWLRTRLARQSVGGAIEDGGEITLRGIKHRIVHSGQMRGLTQSIDSEIGHILSVSGLEDHLPRRICDFLKKEARRDLERLAEQHARSVGKPIRSLSLKDTRSRWGSCSWDGKLSFSWRIVMAPPPVIDYLAAHEVAHLREMNHGPAFWTLCRELCPHMDESKAWLKRHGSALHAIDFS